MKLPTYPQYVPTADAWVGSVPQHWKFMRADFATTSNKEQISERDMEGVQVLHYSIPNVQEFGSAQVEDGDDIDSAKLLVTKTQLLVSKLNPRKATVCIASPDEKLLTVCSGEFVPIIPESDVALKYCYYAWLSDKVTKRLSSQTQSVTRSHQRVSPEDILKLPWAWPSPKEQQQIAAFLDWKTGQIDALIARKQELLEKLKEKRLAVITQAVTRGLNPAAPTRDSGIPWIGQMPAHWEAANIRRFAVMRTGHTPDRNEPTYWDDCDIPWFTLADVWQLRDGRRVYLGKTKECISRAGLANSAAELLPAGTVIFSRTASVGFSGIMPTAMATTQDFWNWIPESKIVSEYLLFQFRAMWHEFRKLTMGSTHKTIYQPDAASLRVCVPPIAEQKAIVAHIVSSTNKLDGLIDKVIAVVDRLTEYRSALITAATTGKIDVRSVKIPEPH